VRIRIHLREICEKIEMADPAPGRPLWRGGKPFPPVGYVQNFDDEDDEDDDDDDINKDYGGRWVDGVWVPPGPPKDHLSPAEVSAVIERHIKREKRNREMLAAEAKEKEDIKNEFSEAAAGVLSAASGQSFTTDWAKGAISAAFEAGLAQGRREQMPAPPCKSCMIRKERNRVAARESRRKKNLFEARDVLRNDDNAAKLRALIKEAADVAASRRSAPSASSSSAASIRAAGGGVEVASAAEADKEEEGDLEPPPF